MYLVARLCAFVLGVVAAVEVCAFEGRLLNPEGVPLVGARVQVLGGRGSAVVDAEGHFVLDPCPEPPFDLLITRPDGVLIQPLRVEAIPGDGPLVLHASAAMSGTLTVQGGAPDLELPPAVAVTVVGRGDLSQRNPTQITDVLEGIPGTGANGSGHTAVPALRGLASSRTLILLDEGRITSERRAGPSATFVDPASVEEVEIVRGPGSVAYGSDAFGGIIRMRTRLPSPGEAFSLRYGVAGSTNDHQRAVDADVSTNLFGGGFLVGGSYRKFDNYSSPEGEVAMSGLESMSLRTGYQRELGPGIFRFLWRSDLGRDVGKAAADSANKPTSYPEEESHRATLAYEQAGPGEWSRLAVSLFWDEYRLLTEKEILPTSSKPHSLALADVFAHDFGLRLEAERPVGAFRMILGLDASGRFGLQAVNRNTTFGNNGDPITETFERSIDNADKDDLGVFVGLSTPIGNAMVSTGVRMDWVSTSNNGGHFGDVSTSDSDFSGFIGTAIPLGANFELSAQLARGFRDPLLSDRYYRGISGRGFITGNPELKPETSFQGDLSLRYTNGPLRLAAYAYDYRIEDLIERYKEGSDYYFRNRGTAGVRGIELEAVRSLGEALVLQLAAQWQRGKAVDDHAFIDGVPPAGLVITLRRETESRWSWFGRVGLFDRDDEPGPNELERSGFVVVDGGVGYQVNDGLQLQLTGRNLLDRSYFASADDNAVLEPGRTLTLSLRGRM